jgi:hypothetical protein
MSVKKRNQKKLIAASDVLQSLLQNGKSPLSPGFTRWRLEKEWVQVVGESTAAVSLPVSYDKGTLWLWVQHPSWMQQLSFFELDICQRVNTHLGYDYARKVRFTLDRNGSMAQYQSRPDIRGRA